jgi:hypothetical protein
MQNQALFRGLNNLPNMSQCHKQSVLLSKLCSKNTSRNRYLNLIFKTSFPSPMKCKPCASIYQRAIRIKNHRCNIPSCHRQQLSGSHHQIHRCLSPGKCPFHVISHKIINQKTRQIVSCKFLRYFELKKEKKNVT